LADAPISHGERHGGSGPQQSGVLAWGRPELAAVFAAELRRAVIADRAAHPADVTGPGGRHQARLLQPDLFLGVDPAGIIVAGASAGGGLAAGVTLMARDRAPSPSQPKC
jgi:hypothetical protein